ncbi:MAG: translation initiation factor IF-2 [Lachnospiraceae bacterium]|nr:translation initiation factor IF-2 [Lachnospiraceae bacterium]
MRISNFSKKWVNEKGDALSNKQTISLLEKHGVMGKTASSNIEDADIALIVPDIKAQGYRDTEEGNAPASGKAEKSAEAKQEEKKTAQPVKAEPAKTDAAVNTEAKKPEAAKQETNKSVSAAKPEGNKSAAPRPAGQPQAGNGQPVKKKKLSGVIIVGRDGGKAGAYNKPSGNGAYPGRGADNRARGPIRPRENMIDRAGAAARREEDARSEAERENATKIAAEEAEKAQAAQVAETPAAEPKTAETKSVENKPVVTERPATSESRPVNRENAERQPQNQAGKFQQREQNGGANRYQGNRADGQNRFQGNRQQQGNQNRFGGNQAGGSRPSGGRPMPGARPAAGRTEAAPVPQDNRRNKHSEKDRDRESRRDSRYMDDDGRGKDRNSNAGRFVKPVAKKVEEPVEDIKLIKLPEMVTIKVFAERMHIQPAEIVKKLFMQGKMVTVNQEISFEEAEEIALDYEIMCEKEEKVDVIAELLKEDEEDESKMVSRPPVICVMGHVDHGKTSLLDAIRKTNVIDHEAGGITQKIGAYTVKVDGRKITFLDTPGHEAFTAMRMRGANATDIAVLVVAADDGVMPQTVEAINHAKAAGIELIVAVNKIDKPGANIDRVKQELTEHELVAEDWGGTTVFVPVSAKSGEGIEQLLEMILLTADVLELKANPNRRARGLVIEAELDKGRGPVATVLVQKGTLRVGDFVSAGVSHGKVRAMIDDKGNKVKEAGPSTPVEILGLSDVPNAGEVFICHSSEKEAKSFAATFVAQNKEKLVADTKAKMSLDDLFDKIKEGNLKELNLIVKADVQGSVEAVKQSLEKLSNDEVLVKVIHGGVGAINESDVVLASASNAIIIGFDVRPDAVAKQTAEREGVDIRLYKVIYQAIEDVEAAMKGMLEPIYEEKVIGHAEVRQIFKASAIGNIAGSFVMDGRITRDSKVRITREGEQIFEGPLASLKRFKDDVKEVKEGYECGLVFEGFDKIQELDMVEAYIMVEVPRD